MRRVSATNPIMTVARLRDCRDTSILLVVGLGNEANHFDDPRELTCEAAPRGPAEFPEKGILRGLPMRARLGGAPLTAGGERHQLGASWPRAEGNEFIASQRLERPVERGSLEHLLSGEIGEWHRNLPSLEGDEQRVLGCRQSGPGEVRIIETRDGPCRAPERSGSAGECGRLCGHRRSLCTDHER
jgi:hypothetical protein